MGKKIILLGPFGYGNLGDAAIQQAVIRNLQRRCPEIELYGVSLNPTDTEKRHHIKSYPLDKRVSDAVVNADPIPAPHVTSDGHFLNWVKALVKKATPLYWSLKTIKALWDQIGQLGRNLISETTHCVGAYRFLRGKHLLLISGGGQLDEYWGGPWQQPYALLKWCNLARVCGLKVAFLSTGVGSIESRLTRLFLRNALKLSHYRSFRDEGSLEMVQRRLGVRADNYVVPDMAYSLEWPVFSLVPSQVGQRLTVGIGPMSYFDPRGRVWPEQDGTVYSTYVEKLACFSFWLWQEGYTIIFFTGEAYHDRPVIKDVRKQMHRLSPGPLQERITEEPIWGVNDLLGQLACVDVAIASRFHSVLLSHLLRKPVLAISYERKVTRLMQDMEQSKYCINIETFTVEELQTLFTRLLQEREDCCRVLDARVAICRAHVGWQYDHVSNL
jgi:polysaccharide pyruvyl transferase WcaK-like protein